MLARLCIFVAIAPHVTRVIFRLWRKKLRKSPPSQLPREILDMIFLIAVKEETGPLCTDEEGRTTAYAVSQVLLVDRSAHKLIRQILRAEKGDIQVGNSQCRASRIVEAAFLETLYGQPDQASFCAFEAALDRWWPLHNSQPIYVRTCRQVRQLITPNGAVPMPARTPIFDFTTPTNSIIRVTKVPPRDSEVTHYRIITQAWNAISSPSPIIYGRAGPDFVISHGMHFGALVCRIFFSFVEAGDTVKLHSCGLPPGLQAAMIVRATAYDFETTVRFKFDDDQVSLVSDDDIRYILENWRSMTALMIAWMSQGQPAA